MHRLGWLVVAGCGSGIVRAPVTNRAVTRDVCTDALVADLTHRLAERWHVEHLELRCAAGRFGTTGYFIEARNEHLHRTGIVDASCAELVPFVDEPESPEETRINGYEAADLDGDGEDEIIESWRRITGGPLGSDNWLVVRRIENREFSRIRGPFLSVYNPELGGCSATWELSHGAIIVAVEALPGIAPSDCLSPGKHRFALRGGAVTEH